MQDLLLLTLQAQIEELMVKVRRLELEAQRAQTSWAQKVFLIQPDSGNTLYSESVVSYSGTNPTTVPLSDQSAAVCRSFLQNELIQPPAGAAGVMQFDNGTTRAYVKLPGGVDLLQAGTNVISATPFINIPTNRGTATLFEFVTSTISGTAGADFQFKAGTSNNAGIYWHSSSSTWVIDYAKFHA